MGPDGFYAEMAREFGKELARQIVEKASELWRHRGSESPLVVFFDERATYHEVRLVDEGDRPARFCHVLVHNGSPHTWFNCVATLKSISSLTADGRFVPDPLYRMPLQLRWAHAGDFRGIDLGPGDVRRLDLCYTVEGSPDLRLAVPRDPHGVKTDYGPGLYKARIEVATKHPVPADGAFLVIHSGEWKEIAVRPDAPGFALTRVEAQKLTGAQQRYPTADVRSLGSNNTQGFTYVSQRPDNKRTSFE